jgi:hypothetical protein
MLLLSEIPVARTTLPNTNTLDWAKTAQLHLSLDHSIRAHIWLEGDCWTLEALGGYGSETFMNVPVFVVK